MGGNGWLWVVTGGYGWYRGLKESEGVTGGTLNLTLALMCCAVFYCIWLHFGCILTVFGCILFVFWLYFGYNRRRGLSAALTLPLPCFPPPWPTDRVKACTEIGTPTCQNFNFANIIIFCCYMDLSMCYMDLSKLFYVFLVLYQTKPNINLSKISKLVEASALS